MNTNTNSQQAIINFKLWLQWYPNDIKGAMEQASDQLETLSDVDELGDSERVMRRINFVHS